MKFNLLAWCLVDVSDDKKNFRLGGTYQVLTGRASPEQRVAGLADQSTSSKRKQANRSATFVNRRHQRVYKCSALETDIESNPEPGHTSCRRKQRREIKREKRKTQKFECLERGWRTIVTQRNASKGRERTGLPSKGGS